MRRVTLFATLVIVLNIFVCIPEAAAKELLRFHGTVDWKNQTFTITLDFAAKGAITVSGKRVNARTIRAAAKLEHIQTPWFDFSSDLFGGWQVIDDQKSGSAFIQGEANSHYSLVDYQPVRDLTAIFQIKDKRLVIQKFVFGPFAGSGAINLESPFSVDVGIQFAGINLNEFLGLWVPERRFDSSGKVAGTIRVQGTLRRPFLRARLESQNGMIKQLAYESIVLNLEGIYPKLNIADSVMTEMEGMTVAVSGPFDLSDPKSYKKQIKSLLLTPLVIRTDSTSEWTIRREGKSDTTITAFKDFFNKSSGREEDAGMIGVKKRISF